MCTRLKWLLIIEQIILHNTKEVGGEEGGRDDALLGYLKWRIVTCVAQH